MQYFVKAKRYTLYTSNKVQYIITFSKNVYGKECNKSYSKIANVEITQKRIPIDIFILCPHLMLQNC